MRIRIFEDIEMNKSYTIVYPEMNSDHVEPYLENENGGRSPITFNKLYITLDKLFKDNHAID